MKAGEASDPYLIAFYDQKSLSLTADKDATIRIEVDPTGNGDWMEYRTEQVKADTPCTYQFPKEFQARWIRFVSDTDATVTAWLEYK